MRIKRVSRVVIVALVSVLLWLESPLQAAQRSIADWASGPTSILMVAEEAEIVAALGDAPLDNAFVDWFWKRRDPTPATALNEVRARFEERVAYVNKEFAEPELGIDGWATARGRIYLLLGPPERIFVSQRPLAVGGAFRRLSHWEYADPRTRRMVRFGFVPTRQGNRLAVSRHGLTPEQEDCLRAAREALIADPTFGPFGEPAALERQQLPATITSVAVANGVLVTMALPLESLLGEPDGDGIRYRFSVGAETAAEARQSHELVLGNIEVRLSVEEFRTWAGLDLHVAVWMPAGVDSYRLTEHPTGRSIAVSALPESGTARAAVGRRLAASALHGEHGVVAAYLPICPRRHPQAEAYLVEAPVQPTINVQPLPGGQLAFELAAVPTIRPEGNEK